MRSGRAKRARLPDKKKMEKAVSGKLIIAAYACGGTHVLLTSNVGEVQITRFKVK